MNEEDYLKFIKAIYDDSSPDIAEDYVWMPAEPIKKKIPEKIGKLNATNLKREDVQKLMKDKKQIDIANFMINIVKYKDNSSDIFVYETKTKTPNGQDCNIQVKIDLGLDKRFFGLSIDRTKLLPKKAINLTDDELLNVVRWLQVVEKLKAFI